MRKCQRYDHGKTAAFAIFDQFVESTVIISQKFVIERDIRTVPNAKSMNTIQEVSRIECAMIFTNINNCCSGTYEKSLEQCSLNLACNTTLKTSEGSQTILKIPQQDACSNGWMSFSNHCYLFVYGKFTWENAKIECQNKDAHLVKIDNSDEHSWITSVLTDEVWIGLTDIQSEGHLIWDFDMSSLTFNQWPDGQPGGGFRENCCHYCKQRCGKSSFVWNDTKCSLANGYVCEKPS
ncbi:unnamed protein product [Mytilus coruscus]|uniref:C-type lectin domain-containing protein n=1 Tax=Mytilus coruscus TaxID=42192 RepID=A0A6J8CJR4_MYTCO|nr:unnamed protein product [Mytilus coruscus]